MDNSVNVNVSGVFQKNGKLIAYVSFTDGKRSAEGIIPDCEITRNDGFNETEKGQLEQYMKDDLENLKKMASKVNVVTAFMGPEDKRKKTE